MDKKELIKQVASDTGMSKDDVSRVVNKAIDVIIDELTDGAGMVRLLGFGTFNTVQRPAKVGRHPCTGKPMHIPPAMVVRFKEGSVLKRGLEHVPLSSCPEAGCRSVLLNGTGRV